jgi:hypothetical protein
MPSLAVFAVLLLVGCTAQASSPDFPRGRDDCPIGHIRANDATLEDAFERMMGYVPTLLPDGFGVAHAFDDGDWFLAQIVFVDSSCREIHVGFADGHRALGNGSPFESWVVGASGPRDCGNAVLGDGRCLRYATHVDDGTISILSMGLERGEMDPVVDSIDLDG